MPYWSAHTGNSNKSRSGTTIPSNSDVPNGHSASGNGEEQSRPERKREREKRRRESMNTRFTELAACLTTSAGGKSDKESILLEAVQHVRKQDATILKLEKQNRELRSEVNDLRGEKNELRHEKNYTRGERDRLKAELDSLKSEMKGRKSQKAESESKREDMMIGSTKRNDNSANARKSELATV